MARRGHRPIYDRKPRTIDLVCLDCGEVISPKKLNNGRIRCMNCTNIKRETLNKHWQTMKEVGDVDSAQSD